MYHRFVTTAKIVKKGATKLFKKSTIHNCHFSPDINSWQYRAGTRLSILIVMKPRRCRAILFQKVDPIGFFNSRQNIGIGISTCKNVLVDLESCVGMCRWIILCPKRLQGKFPHHYTYSNWLNWIYSPPAPDRPKYPPGLVKLRQPYLNQMYYI